ncbi:MAG: hypothetical protein IPG22_16395 [Acidobacteria bacterium]|nr:hypothetical protein [Acidobacteriota bacterium]
MLEKLGLVKLVEECGELQQIAAKKMARMDTDEHWDGAGSLKERLEDEIGDVMAAVSVVVGNFDLDDDRIFARGDRKRELFEKWMTEDQGDAKEM